MKKDRIFQFIFLVEYLIYLMKNRINILGNRTQIECYLWTRMCIVIQMVFLYVVFFAVSLQGELQGQYFLQIPFKGTTFYQQFSSQNITKSLCTFFLRREFDLLIKSLILHFFLFPLKTVFDLSTFSPIMANLWVIISHKHCIQNTHVKNPPAKKIQTITVLCYFENSLVR